MSNANDGLLWFEAPERTEAQLTDGLAAAHRVLRDAEAGIEEAYRASWQPEALAGTGRRLSAREQELYDLWWEASDEALKAAGIDSDGIVPACLFPADLGKERNATAHADLGSGRVLEVIPPPDYGPYFTVKPPAQ